MSYLLGTVITFAVVLLFVVVLIVERTRERKFFPTIRARFDARVERAIYIVEHIDWGAFFGHVLKLSLEKIAHDIVHGVLLMVRTVERSLTRAIRVLRERLAYRSDSSQASEGFELTKTIQRFRKNMKRDQKNKE
jgi:hypothetical protein